MDNSNWRPQTPSQGRGGAGGDAPAAGDVDWRAQLGQSSRDEIINKIQETLKKHLPVSGPDGLNELKKIAVRFEEKIYQVASSQSDYLSRISMKMLAMEPRLQNTIPNAMTSNSDVSINSNWRPQTPSQGRGGAGGDAPAAGDVDWRALLEQSSRDEIINKIEFLDLS